MEWDSTLSPALKAPANKGRRAGLSLLSPRSEDKHSASNDFTMDNDPSQPVAPPRARRTGGWADEAIKSGKKRTVVDSERFGIQDKKYDSDDDIPLIPELEDAAEEEPTNLAAAPSIAMNRLATFKELDLELLKNPSFTKLDDINLSLLARNLHSEEECAEETDDVWTLDSLLTEVSSILRREEESKNIDSDRSNSS